MTQLLKSRSSVFYFPISSTLSIFIFLCFTSENPLKWLILSMILSLPLLFKPHFFLLTIVFLFLAFLVFYLHRDKIQSTYIKGNYKVLKNTSLGPMIKFEHSWILIKTRTHYNVGDKIYISGAISKVENNNSFDLIHYLKSYNTFHIVLHPKIHLLEETNDIRVSFFKYIHSSPKYYNMVTPLILLGEKTNESKALYDLSIKMSIVHLFVISGFHISLFFSIIKKILIFLRVKESTALWIGLIPILIYLFLINFSISATRASLLVFLSVVNKNILKNKYKTIETLSLTMIIMFIYKPWQIFSLSFSLTFIATFSIVLTNMIPIKNKILKICVIYVAVYLSNIPIISSMNGYIPIFGFFYGIFLSPIFVFVYTFSIFLFPLKVIVNHIDFLFIHILNFTAKTNILVHFGYFDNKWVFLSYGLFMSSIIIWVIWNSFTVKKVF